MESHLYVYKLISPDLLLLNQQLIKAALCFGQRVEDFDFTINPVSGWMRLVHKKHIHSTTTKKNLPIDSPLARQFAEQYFGRVNEIIQTNVAFNKTGLPILFSMKLQHAYTTYVPQLNTGFADHWLSRYQIILPHGLELEETYAGVLGAGVDIRIGDNGLIIGLSYSFRLWSEKKAILVDEKLLQEAYNNTKNVSGGHIHDSSPSHDHETSLPPDAPEEEENPVTTTEIFNELIEAGYRITYHMNGSNTAQQYLSPNLASLIGHHMTITPLTVYSLHVRITYKLSGSNILAEALVTGGAGPFEFEWAYWKIHAFEKGITLAGNSASILVPMDVYNLAVTVRDTFTQEKSQYQVMTYIHSAEIAKNNSNVILS